MYAGGHAVLAQARLAVDQGVTMKLTGKVVMVVMCVCVCVCVCVCWERDLTEMFVVRCADETVGELVAAAVG